MSKFNVYQAIYEVSQQNKSASHEVKSDDRPYAEVLEIVRGEISKNHSGELANVITEPQGAALLKNLLSKYIYQKHLTCREYNSLNELVDKCYEDMAGFGFLTKYIYDDEIEEINCNAWNDIEIVTALGWKKIDEHFLSPMQCIDMTKKMCQLGGVIIDGSQPTQDSYITQGVRISAIIPPCIDDDIGAVFSIRKQKTNTITKEQLIKWDTATDDELDLLILCIEHGVSLGIAGSTGSGKTTDIGFILKN
ncbi:MAG: ATPase, T2SS/T4P/T4SS family, partial [Monoglobaceae bacterium]